MRVPQGTGSAARAVLYLDLQSNETMPHQKYESVTAPLDVARENCDNKTKMPIGSQKHEPTDTQALCVSHTMPPLTTWVATTWGPHSEEVRKACLRLFLATCRQCSRRETSAGWKNAGDCINKDEEHTHKETRKQNEKLVRPQARIVARTAIMRLEDLQG